jgi:hypothetical protein
MTGKNNGLPSRQNLIDAISRAELYSFVRRMFPIVSAGSPFLPNWHVEAITYALTRVMRGEIKRLIITVPVGPENSCGAPKVVMMQSMGRWELDYLALFGWMDRSAVG